jgi:hypothetical protein
MPDDAMERARRAVDDATGGRFKTLSDFTEALLSEEDPVAQDTLIGEAATLLHHFAAFASQQAPGGWVLVPREPTREMKVAGGLAFNPDTDVTVVTSFEAGQAYAAMLDAAPSVTLGEVG